jgi:bacterioferritin (cytochrome b1)
MAFSNTSYDLVAVLENKMKAVAAYDRYIEDFRKSNDVATCRLLEEIKRDDERHVENLREALETYLESGKFGSVADAAGARR